MALAEDARQAEWENVSFTAEVFKGSFRWDLVHPFPAQSPEDRKIGDDYLVKVREVLERHVDPYQIDEQGEYPAAALDAMAAIGLFGMKIPQEYGGLGFSITNYARVLGHDRELLFQHGHVPFGAPEHRRAATVARVRYRGAEAQVPAATRAG